jgi:hypothetical protein
MKRLALLVAAIAILAMSCSAESAPPALDAEQQGELTAQAIVRACGNICKSNPVYVRDELLEIDTLVGQEEPMPVEVSQAISNAYPEATFVDREGADLVIADVDAGEAVLLNVAEVTELAPEVLGIDIGVSFIAFHGQTIQFVWNGSTWVVADSEGTGVTVTSVVS